MPSAPRVTSTGPEGGGFRARANRSPDVMRTALVFELMAGPLPRVGMASGSWRSACHQLPTVGATSVRAVRMAHLHSVTSPIQTATATLHTNRGDIKIALFGNHA